MSRILAVLLSAVLFVGTALPAAAITYKYPSHGVVLRIPTGWENISKSSEYRQFVPPDGSLSVVVQPLTNSDVMDAVKGAMTTIRGIIPNMKATGKSRKVKINGFPGVANTFVGNNKEGTPLAINLTVLATQNTRFFLFVSIIPQAIFAQGKDAVEVILESIKPQE